MGRARIHGAEYPIKKIFSDDFVFNIPLYNVLMPGLQKMLENYWMTLSLLWVTAKNQLRQMI